MNINIHDYIRRRYGLLTIFLLFHCLVNNAFAQSQENLGAAEGQTEIKPLEIGDTIPEEIWNMPFQVVKYNEKPKTIKLAEYKGKVIIIDYWATWCKSCIASMPKMHSLAHAHLEEVVLLPVTHESKDVIKKFLDVTSSSQIRNIEDVFHTVVAGEVLKDLIPHSSLPHIAIINKEGILEQATTPLYLNEEILGQIIAEQDYYMPAYHASLETTLLSPTFTNVRQYKPFYYSSVTGYVDGFMFPYNETSDTTSGIQTGHFINRPILQLFNNARPTGLALLPNRRIILTDDPLLIEYHHLRNSSYSHQKQSYSYEYVLPLSMTKEDVRRRMWSDLNILTGYRAQIVQKEMPCIVLRKSVSGRKIIPAKDSVSMMYVLNGISQERIPRDVGRSSEGFLSYMKGVTVKGMVLNLNKMVHGAIPFIIDETEIDHRIDIGFPDDILNIDALVSILGDQGIDVAIENRMMDMFVISDRPIDSGTVQEMPIKLTKIGYVPEKGEDDE